MNICGKNGVITPICVNIVKIISSLNSGLFMTYNNFSIPLFSTNWLMKVIIDSDLQLTILIIA